MKYLKGHGTLATPQSEPIPGSSQVENSAGGFAWTVTPLQRLRRFLILGSEGGSYYSRERDLTKANVAALMTCLNTQPIEAIDLIVEVSEGGLAPKNDPALLALAFAAAHPDVETRRYALAQLPKVARIGTHLFHFAEFVQGVRGWGPTLRRAVGGWYESKDAAKLAYDVVKYRQRDGWTHRDMLRLSHPSGASDAHKAIYDWVAKGDLHHAALGAAANDADSTLRLLYGFQRAQEAKTPAETATLTREYGLPREALNPEHLTAPGVWEALLDTGMPLTAMIRNLANMTRVGLLTPGADATKTVLAALVDPEKIRRARIHPIQMLIAQRTYEAGQGLRGRNTWTPIVQVVDALDEGFYLAFGNVPSSGKRTLLALDVSGSMTGGAVAGVPGLSPRDASAAMALVTARAEQKNYECVGFFAGEASRGGWLATGRTRQMWGNQTGLTPLPLSPRQRLTDVVRMVHNLPFGGTDCALPMLYALDKEREVDTFVIYTDSETWAGGVHPSQALAKYRAASGIDSRLVIVGMVSNGFSIADPNDAGMLDVVGFDTSAPRIISEFADGKV